MLKIVNCPIAALYNLLYVLSKWCTLTTCASDAHEEDVLKVFDDNPCSGLHITCNPFASIYCSSWKQYCQLNSTAYITFCVGLGWAEWRRPNAHTSSLTHLLCIFICVFSVTSCTKRRSHTGQACGFSPVCRITWFLSVHFLPKARPHSVHTYGLWPRCTLRTCRCMEATRTRRERERERAI